MSAEARNAARLRREWGVGLSLPVTPIISTSLDGFRTPKQIMDELREAEPETAMLLGEYVVIEEDGDRG